MRSYFIQPDVAQWKEVAEKIGTADWNGAKHLSEMMLSNQFNDWEGVIYIEEKEKIVAFTSIVKKDIVDTDLYTPYIAVVYVFPEYRGQFLTKFLIKRAEDELKKAGFDEVFLVTQLEDFYEKLNYNAVDQMYDKFDRLLTVLSKRYLKNYKKFL